MSGTIGFPDGPRSDLDRALADVLDSAQRVLATQGRLRNLLKATSAANEELDLGRTLRRITEAAMGLVGAKYGALGVIAPDGTLEQFIHVGMPEADVVAIGHLPEGHGLLGALIDEQHPIRLEHLRDDPRSSGFPEHHPPMESFLGVPIRVRGEAYGNLYLSEQADGSFSEEDEELLIALAASAAVAIDNARLFERTVRQQAWSAAAAEVSAALLSGGVDDALALVADRVVQITESALACIVLPTGTGPLRVEVARGDLAHLVDGLVFEADDTLAGRAIASEQPMLDDIGGARVEPVEIDLGPSMALPLRSSAGVAGAITVARSPGSRRFLTEDLELAADFSDQASVALELARSRADSQRLELLDDRSRIARDLHDHVIQRLFGAGLSLQALAARERDAAVRDQMLEQVATLDSAIADIRTAIFAMTTNADDTRPALRHQVIDVVGELSGSLGFTARVAFAGPVDLVVDGPLAEDILAVVREGLSNVARHASASAAEVGLEALGETLVVVVRDNGHGVPDRVRRSSGVSNLRKRAERRGGGFDLGPGDDGGTTLRWTVPIRNGTEAG